MGNNERPENNGFGLDSTDDFEHIKDIEKLLDEHNKNCGAKKTEPKRYLRNSIPEKAQKDNESTIVMRKVPAQTPKVTGSSPKKAESEHSKERKTEKTNNSVPSGSGTAASKDKNQTDATVTMAAVDAGKEKHGKNIGNEEIVTARHPAVRKKENDNYNPLLNENEDFAIDDNPEPDETAVKGTIGALTSVAKAVIYLVSVLAVSIILAVVFISLANDIFAFVKDDTEVTVVVPENCDTETLAKLLHESGAIKHPGVFKMYIEFKKLDGEYLEGTYRISPSLNYDYMIREFKPKAPERTTVVVTIPEGYSVDQIVKLLIDKGLGTYEGYVRAINEYDFDYRFLDELGEPSEDRFWRLEGYLYPDTYYYYSTATEETVIYKMLENFNNKFTEEYYERAKELGMTVDELVTLASMIEKEVRYADEYGNVSSVFHNRLKNSANFPHLDSDATIMYAIEHDTGERPETLKDTSYESPYNTYKCIGLPPGPIANPSMEAIRYAMYPNSTNYYYFVSGSNGRTVFSRTYAEHLRAIAELE